MNHKQLDCGKPELKSLNSLRHAANERKCENIELRNNVTKNRKWLDVKMGEQKALYDRMVANYHRMIAKSRASEERLDQAGAKNGRFQVMALCMAERIEELISCHVLPVRCSVDSNCSLNSDNAQSFEVSRPVDLLFTVRKQ